MRQENVYFSDLYTSEAVKTGSKRRLRKDAVNESNMSMVLEGLNEPKAGPGKSSKNLFKKPRVANFGSGLNSETQSKVKKKKKKDTSSVQMPKELVSCLLDVLLDSKLDISRSIYRKLLRLLFEGLDLIETKSKNLFNNRNLVVNYLELLVKLLVRNRVHVYDSQSEQFFGQPDVFPLKLKLNKPKNQKKSVLAKLEKKLNLKTKTTLFNNKRHLNQVLLMFRRIAQKAQNLLGFDVEETVQKMVQDKQFQSQSKRGALTSSPTSHSNLRVETEEPASSGPKTRR